MEESMRYELTKDLETGNAMIDNEHRKLFQIVNQLLEACDKGEVKTTLKPVIEFLLKYVIEHFQHEEQLQEQGGYPGIEEHKAFHAKYKEDLRKILLQIPPTGPTINDIVAINGHVSLLVNHLKTEDKKMCSYIKDGV